MTVKSIGNRKHKASEYVKLKMYLPGKIGTAVMERELHIVDDLAAKALIGIDIMKPEQMMVDLGNDVMKVSACDDIEVPIVAVTRGAPSSATVYSSKRMTIPAHSNVAVPVTGPGKALKLPDNSLVHARKQYESQRYHQSDDYGLHDITQGIPHHGTTCFHPRGSVSWNNETHD